MVTVKVSDFKKIVMELEKNNIELVHIAEFCEFKFNDEITPKSLRFGTYDRYGDIIDFDSIYSICKSDNELLDCDEEEQYEYTDEDRECDADNEYLSRLCSGEECDEI